MADPYKLPALDLLKVEHLDAYRAAHFRDSDGCQRDLDAEKGRAVIIYFDPCQRPAVLFESFREEPRTDHEVISGSLVELELEFSHIDFLPVIANGKFLVVIVTSFTTPHGKKRDGRNLQYVGIGH